MPLTRDIKEFALDLGYHAVGITTAEPFEITARELEARRDDYRWLIDGRLRMLECTTPTSIMPDAKSIIVTVFDYAREGFAPELVGKVGRLYQARCYSASRKRIHGMRRQLFVDFLEGMGLRVMLGPDINVPERMAAARAGVATFGRNNFAYTKDAGSFVMLTTFAVDGELEYDRPTVVAPCPEDCRLCIDACPTGALEPFKLSPRRCIAYNCFMTQDNLAPTTSSYIPVEIREQMGSWIHGCDLCQEVCPRNRSKLQSAPPVSEFLSVIASRFNLHDLLHLTDEYFEETVRPIMYNYIRHKKYFQRNAAIALGNSGDRAHVPVLLESLEDRQALVRGYCAWALGRLGGTQARAGIEKALSRETDESARSEMEAALRTAVF